MALQAHVALGQRRGLDRRFKPTICLILERLVGGKCRFAFVHVRHRVFDLLGWCSGALGELDLVEEAAGTFLFWLQVVRLVELVLDADVYEIRRLCLIEQVLMLFHLVDLGTLIDSSLLRLGLVELLRA